MSIQVGLNQYFVKYYNVLSSYSRSKTLSNLLTLLEAYVKQAKALELAEFFVGQNELEMAKAAFSKDAVINLFDTDQVEKIAYDAVSPMIPVQLSKRPGEIDNAILQIMKTIRYHYDAMIAEFYANQKAHWKILQTNAYTDEQGTGILPPNAVLFEYENGEKFVSLPTYYRTKAVERRFEITCQDTVSQWKVPSGQLYEKMAEQMPGRGGEFADANVESHSEALRVLSLVITEVSQYRVSNAEQTAQVLLDMTIYYLWNLCLCHVFTDGSGNDVLGVFRTMAKNSQASVARVIFPLSYEHTEGHYNMISAAQFIGNYLEPLHQHGNLKFYSKKYFMLNFASENPIPVALEKQKPSYRYVLAATLALLKEESTKRRQQKYIASRLEEFKLQWNCVKKVLEFVQLAKQLPLEDQKNLGKKFNPDVVFTFKSNLPDKDPTREVMIKSRADAFKVWIDYLIWTEINGRESNIRYQIAEKLDNESPFEIYDPSWNQ